MGKLRVLSWQEACAILGRHGFVEVRRRSSHIVMQCQEESGTTTVPVPDHRELRCGSPGSACRASGLLEPHDRWC
ncbi:MAG: type II toxin-antitoxin system HicA family toxin [Planctomycetaceae bacterium]|nr:type II toxin-antitoxin system HicA family toxin [Planctomycetaceae bacterium]